LRHRTLVFASRRPGLGHVANQNPDDHPSRAVAATCQPPIVVSTERDSTVGGEKMPLVHVTEAEATELWRDRSSDALNQRPQRIRDPGRVVGRRPTRTPMYGLVPLTPSNELHPEKAG
jgi:hypothetical protein